jgi:hypothetical protein
MRPPKLVNAITVIAYFVSASGVAHAWNFTGHRVIATIAFRQLDEPTKKKVSEILKTHPAYNDLWAAHAHNGPDESLNLFWNASIFPDEARRPPWEKYGRPSAHYVNFRIRADDGNRVEPPLDGENVLNSYIAHLRQIEDVKTLSSEKAVHLSWVFHQAEDVHQPLHTVARFSNALPNGDRGGNAVSVPNPRGFGARGNNLHAYWDGLLGTEESPDAVQKLAGALLAEYPREAFREELTLTNIGDWADEGISISLKTVYNNLDANITNFADLPIGYEADAQRVARRRAALAGYRLADELKRLFATP